jgi:hypothetical protein
MNMFTPTDAATPEEYLAALPEPRRSDVRALDELIRRAAPGLGRHLQSGMLGYGSYRYRTRAGAEGDWFVVGLAGRKAYVSLYVTADCDGAYLAEQFRDRLPKADIGRSCVRIKRLGDVDLDVVSELVRRAAEWTPPTT